MLISFVGIFIVAAVNRFVIGILLSGHAALREGQPQLGAPRFGWIMIRLPAVPMLEYRPASLEPPRELAPKKRRNWGRILRQ